MILSASRRTDIPSFYAPWFMHRLRAGFVRVRNPMNASQVSEVPLTPRNVDCIVFWTKDPLPLMAYLDEIDGMGYPYYFQFTVTPYGKDIEGNVRDKAEIFRTLHALSERIGKMRVVPRYDPVLLTDRGPCPYTVDFHVRAFRKFCEAAEGCAEKAVVSFFDDYRKFAANVKTTGMRAPTENEMHTLAEGFAAIALQHGLGLETCAEAADLAKFGIGHAKCIDGDLIERILGGPIAGKGTKDGNRAHCGCMKSVDVGQYDTCVRQCLYCYANAGRRKALENFKNHSPESALLAGESAAMVRQRSEKDTRSLKI